MRYTVAMSFVYRDRIRQAFLKKMEEKGDLDDITVQCYLLLDECDRMEQRLNEMRLAFERYRDAVKKAGIEPRVDYSQFRE